MARDRAAAMVDRAETALPPVAAIGAPPTFEATLVAIRPYEGAYGMVYFVEMDADGRRVIWPASTYPAFNPGDRVRVTATVKAHETYKGIPFDDAFGDLGVTTDWTGVPADEQP